MTKKSTREAFAERIRQALNEAGYGRAQLKELGQLFEVTPQAVRKWLSGDSVPSHTRAVKIAQILGVRRAWLMDGELPVRLAEISVREESNIEYSKIDETMLSISGNEYRLIQRFRSLPNDLQNAVETIVEEVSRSTKPS